MQREDISRRLFRCPLNRFFTRFDKVTSLASVRTTRQLHESRGQPQRAVSRVVVSSSTTAPRPGARRVRYFKGVSSFGLTVAMPSLRLTGPVIRTRCVMYGAIFALLFATHVPVIS